MSVSYFVSCRDCKVTRDLGVFYSMREATNRAEAVNIAMDIRDRDTFRAALLASFMWAHKGHNCTVFNEHDEALSEELDPFENKHGVKEDPVGLAIWWRREAQEVLADVDRLLRQGEVVSAEKVTADLLAKGAM